MYNENMKRYFTSDLHLSHRLVSRLRGFGEDVAAHDAYIIKTWNSVVRPDDCTWILGDLTLRNPMDVAALVDQLNGTKMLVLGNHDKAHPRNSSWLRAYWDTAPMFDFVGVIAAARMNNCDVVMSHFPYDSDGYDGDRFDQWRPLDCGAFLLHGHTHSNDKQSAPNSLHVGWDAWGRPVSESEVMRYVNRWSELA